MRTVLVETHLFGDIELTYRDSAIVATYTVEPSTEVSITRTGKRSRNSPIGTRDESALQAVLDGRDVPLSPGRARLSKRTYRVGFEIDGRVLTLAARTLTDSRLLDGTSDTGENCFGELTRTHDGIEITWAVPFRFMTRTIEPPIPTRDDVLVAVCVAAAFGTGGLSVATVVMGFVDALLP
ncbi:hypothetical protein [Rhodococcoides corynebacterioides]|uniref:hypothetical protein n=1 Tax=Rhodococcoides corynebacterioides TaxID=53972 RepID=UPI003F7FD2B1